MKHGCNFSGVRLWLGHISINTPASEAAWEKIRQELLAGQIQEMNYFKCLLFSLQ